MIEQQTEVGPELEPVIERLNRDTLEAARHMSADEARYLVDTYYQRQDDRKRAANQTRATDDSGEPNRVIEWLTGQSDALETRIRSLLDAYSGAQPIGQWARNIVGIGPVIAAGLMAHIDINRAPTVGHIWRFAGLDPTSEWIGRKAADAMVKEVITGNMTTDEAMPILAQRAGMKPDILRKFAQQYAGEGKKIGAASVAKALARCPWNAQLKVLCWKIGESFVKVSGHPKDIYGHVYLDRKAYESAKNEAGDYAAQAEAKLVKFKIGKDTEAYSHYSKGRLPPAHIHSRAKRYAVKLFLAHYHGELYRLTFGKEPPLPYPIAHLGHAHVK